MTGGSFRSGLIGTPLSDNGEGVLANGGAALSDVSITSGGIGLDLRRNPGRHARHGLRSPHRRGWSRPAAVCSVTDSMIDVVHGAGTRAARRPRDIRRASSGPFSIGARHVSISGNRAGLDTASTSRRASAGSHRRSHADGLGHPRTATAAAPPAVSGATANLTHELRRLPAGDYTGTGPGDDDGRRRRR